MVEYWSGLWFVAWILAHYSAWKTIPLYVTATYFNKAVKHYVGKTEHPADNYHLTVYIKQTICGVAISWCYSIVTLMFTETF